jgi:thioredoxin-like negative regulator of GroEL
MADDRIVELITRGQFKLFIQDHNHIIVKACATWCGPCKRSTPFFMENFNKLPEKVKMVNLDVDVGSDLARYLKIKSMPTFIHFYRGEPMEIYMSSDETSILQFFEAVKKYL